MTGASAQEPQFWRPERLELAAGWIPGHDNAVEAPPLRADLTPLRALEDILRPALAAPPCVVAFSGGRDSSLLLAVAAKTARREGLPAPIAATRRYPRHEDTNESAWQELVIRHTRTEEWVRLEFDDELDILGPVAGPKLRRYGVLWPPLLHCLGPVEALARGGTVVTGEGGDEYLGGRRSAVLKHFLRRRGRVSRYFLKEVYKAAAPRRARRRIIARKYQREEWFDWLQPSARAAVIDQVANDEASEPLSWRDSIGRLPSRRTALMASWNMHQLALTLGTRYVEPLMDPAFVGALRASAARLGYSSRTDSIGTLFPGLLPPELVAREDKANFDQPTTTAYTSEFLAGWSGGGLDTDLVDPDAIRAEWASLPVHVGTLLTLQKVWLADQGLPVEGEQAAQAGDATPQH